jgi:hypothetical protein
VTGAERLLVIVRLNIVAGKLVPDLRAAQHPLHRNRRVTGRRGFDRQGCDTSRFYEGIEVVAVNANMLAELDERDAALGDETTDERVDVPSRSATRSTLSKGI